MDRTLKTAKRKNKRRQNRNGSVWRRFSPDGTTCRYCKHDHATHLTSSGQSHFYRPATEAEKRDPSVMLYRHTLPQGGSVLVRRMVVANHAELITAFCTACGELEHPPGALLPAQRGRRRGGRGADRPQGLGNRRLTRLGLLLFDRSAGWKAPPIRRIRIHDSGSTENSLRMTDALSKRHHLRPRVSSRR